jgi:hypothetical protein
MSDMFTSASHSWHTLRRSNIECDEGHGKSGNRYYSHQRFHGLFPELEEKCRNRSPSDQVFYLPGTIITMGISIVSQIINTINNSFQNRTSDPESIGIAGILWRMVLSSNGRLSHEGRAIFPSDLLPQSSDDPKTVPLRYTSNVSTETASPEMNAHRRVCQSKGN